MTTETAAVEVFTSKPEVVDRKVVEIQEAHATALAFEREAETFAIETHEDLECAVELAADAKTAQDAITATFSPIIDPIRKYLDGWYEKRRTALGFYSRAESTLKRKIGVYNREAEAKRRREAEALRIRQQMEAEKRREAEALRAIDSGDVERAEVMVDAIEAPVAVDPVELDKVAPPAPKVSGMVRSKRWKARLVGETDEAIEESMRQLCAAIGEGKAGTELVELNQSAADTMARALKKNLGRAIPGLEGYPEEGVAIRR